MLLPTPTKYSNKNQSISEISSNFYPTLDQRGLGCHTLMALSLLASALFIHENLQTFLGFHPNWSIDMAKKYCAKVRVKLEINPLVRSVI